jgi:plastocyanin
LLFVVRREYGRAVSPRSTAFAALAAALVPVASAQAATKTVYMGNPPSAAKTFNTLRADVNAYFPEKITIRRGDKVRFVPSGLHTLDLVRGKSPVGLVTGGAPLAGVRDAAGLPFWFNGLPDLELSAPLLNVAFGKTVTYNGSGELQSGLPLVTKPLTVKFTKTGSFTYYCNIHRGMQGTVNVINGKPPSAKADAKVVKKQISAAVKDARGLQTAFVAKNQVLLGNSSRSGVEILSMFPGSMNVTVGTTLTFSISRWSLAAHTATTGPGDPFTEPDSFLGKISASIRETPPFDQSGVYPSDPRGAPALLTPNLHGNGFWSSGFMDAVGTTPQPKNQQVKIVAPGTYTFYCMLHPFMRVVVNAT